MRTGPHSLAQTTSILHRQVRNFSLRPKQNATAIAEAEK